MSQQRTIHIRSRAYGSVRGFFHVDIDERSYLSIPFPAFPASAYVDTQPNLSECDMSWKDKNFGKHPSDPAYLDGYDPEADKEAYDEACEEREERRREK